MYNPITKAEEIRQKVVNGNSRRYYRVACGGMVVVLPRLTAVVVI